MARLSVRLSHSIGFNSLNTVETHWQRIARECKIIKSRTHRRKVPSLLVCYRLGTF